MIVGGPATSLPLPSIRRFTKYRLAPRTKTA
jgi:hypothetical protein